MKKNIIKVGIASLIVLSIIGAIMYGGELDEPGPRGDNAKIIQLL